MLIIFVAFAGETGTSLWLSPGMLYRMLAFYLL